MFIFLFDADMPLERKTPISYPDSVYEIVTEQSRGNVLLISNITQHGLSGRGSVRRTAFFTFFGKPSTIGCMYALGVKILQGVIIIWLL